MANLTYDNSLWPTPISNQDAKEQVAFKLADKLEANDIIGVGSGSTSFITLLALAKRSSEENLPFSAVVSSIEMALICQKLNIPTLPLDSRKVRWSFDGADEVDGSNNLIKGRGGALFKEKLLIKNSTEVYIVVDSSKRVSRLGEKFPVPIEVFPQAITVVREQVKSLPGVIEANIRTAVKKDGPVITENGNLLLDVSFDHIEETMEAKINSITGVIESGLFMGYNPQVIWSEE